MNHGHTRARTPGRLTHWEDTWACITWSSSTEVAWKHPPCARHRHTTDRSHKGRVREERNPSTKKAQQPQKQQKPQETIRCSQREGEKKTFNPRAPQLEETPETPPSSRAEGLLFLHGLESNPGSSLQTEEEAGLP